MYRRRSNTGHNVLWIIIIGLIVGMSFYIFDQSRHHPEATPLTVTPLPSGSTLPTLAPTVISPDLLTEATLFIPTAGIYSPVIETYLQADGEWEIGHLGNNVGHLTGTGWFDTPGNVVMVGHVEMADGSAGIFKSIADLKTGDPLIVYQSQVEHRYAVTEVRSVEPDDLSVLYPTNVPTLTLITCGAYDFVQNSYQTRVVVVATLVNA